RSGAGRARRRRLHAACLRVRRILPCGSGSVLVECDDGADALQLWNRLTVDRPEGVSEAVPGARTVLVLGPAAHALAKTLLTLPGTPFAPSGSEIAVVPV